MAIACHRARGRLVVGWLDRSATGIQGPLLLLMTTAFLVSLARRAPAWAVALMTVAGLPIAHMIGHALGGAGSASWGMLIAVAPAMLAAYVGAGTGTLLDRASALVERRLLFAVAIVACAALGFAPVYATLVARGQPFAWWVATIWQLVTLIGWAVATPAIVRAWQRGHVDDEPRGGAKAFVTLVGIVIAIAVAHAWLMPIGTRALAIPLGNASLLRAAVWALAAYLPLDALTWVVVTGVAYATDADRRARNAATREGAARGELAVARLAGLRAQLRPHFLFNALNTASVLATRGDADGTRRVLSGLADLLRYAMRGADSPEGPDAGMVPLRDEIAFTEQYLAVERERFPERLRVSIDVAADVQDAAVPALLLQPLAENAIKHGVGGRIGAGIVALRAWREGNALRISVADDGPGPAVSQSDPATGVGLANTRARLAILYGSDAILKLEPRPDGGAIAVVSLPLTIARDRR